MSVIKYILVTFIMVNIFSFGYGQSFEVELSPITIEGLGGLQSYAIGTYEDEWLIVGGRLDGLHRRQPFASFSEDGKNQDIIVVNPKSGNIWRAPLSSLSSNISEQLASTNMQFYQNEDQLICTGGYGYSPSIGDHITFPFLTLIDIPNTIKSIKENSLSSTTFHQIENEMFRVTGGALNKLGDIYYQVGGHNFMGRYNPMGPDHGPGFFQEYTDEIRKFKIIKEENYAIEQLDPVHDAMHFHRRDYNLTPSISDGKKELIINSGVFKNTVDLPWLYPVTINEEGHTAHEEFTQYYNHYHCAYLPIYNSSADEMYTIFFGGIAQFYNDGEILVQDNDVPFVNTIAEVKRNKSGLFTESRLSSTMPGYLGAGSVFIANDNIHEIESGVLDGEQITDEFIEAGYIYGGIRSSLPNIFWINEGAESVASNVIYKVSIRKTDLVSNDGILKQKEYLQFYPNPESQLVRMSIDIDIPTDIEVIISDQMGRRIHNENFLKSEVQAGRNYMVLNNVDVGYGAYNYSVIIGDKLLTRRVIWSE